MNAHRAKELGFCDEVLYDGSEPPEKVSFSYSSKAATKQVMNLVKAAVQPEPKTTPVSRISVRDTDITLENLKY